MKASHCFLLFFTCFFSHAQVGVNTSDPHPSAALDVSTDDGSGGLIIPTVTITERNLIPADATTEGLIVFVEDADINCLMAWDTSNLSWNIIYCQQVNAAPTAGSVEISGDIRVGVPLTGTYTYNDANGDTEGASLYEWIVYDDAVGTNPVSVGTLINYTPTVSDEGKFIRFSVTPVATAGTLTGTQTFSAFEGAILAAGAFAPVAQDFDAQLSWTYSTDIPFFTNGADGSFGVITAPNTNYNPISFNGTSGNKFLGVDDLDDEGDNGTTGEATITFANVDISAAVNPTFEFDYSLNGLEVDDYVRYVAVHDSVDQAFVELVKDGEGTITVAIPGSVTTFALKIVIKQNGQSDGIGLDNFRVFEN